MTGVFISYPRDGGVGQSWAGRVEQWLRDRGVRCFRDSSDLNSAEPLAAALQRHLQDTSLVLCIVCKATRGRDWVARELALADEYRIPIRQLVVEHGSSMIEGGERLRIDFRDSHETGWRDLDVALRDHGIEVAPASSGETPIRAAEVAYLEALVRSQFRVTEQIFVSMHAELADFDGLWRDYEEAQFDVSGRHKVANREVLRDDILAAFEDSPRLAVLGPPGAGKTYALQRVAMALARAALEDAGAPLPVFIKLGDWLAPLEPLADGETAGDPSADRSFQALLEAALGEALAGALDALLANQRIALLLDGLNELTSVERERRQQAVVRWIRAHRAVEGETPPVLLLSCRVADFPEDLRRDLDTLTLQPLHPVQIRAYIQQTVTRHGRNVPGEAGETAEAAAERLFWFLLGDRNADDGPMRRLWRVWQSRGFEPDRFFDTDPATAVDDWRSESLHFVPDGSTWSRFKAVTLRWFRRLFRSPDQATWHGHGERRRLAALSDSRSLLKLAERPFVLMQLVAQYQGDGFSVRRLSGNRVQICERFVAGLLGREAKRIASAADADPAVAALDPASVAPALATLAWAMATVEEAGTNDVASEDEWFSAAGLPYANAVAALTGGEDGMAASSAAAILTFARGAQLLAVGEVVRFSHQLLQEFFTAEGLDQALLHDADAARRLWPREQWWRRSGWEEAMHFLALKHSGDTPWVVDTLLGAQPRLMAEILTGEGEWPALAADERRRVSECLRPVLEPGVESRIEARSGAAIALGRLGLDDRPGVTLKDGLPDIAWCEVPAGEFMFQDGETHTLPVFWISRYAVTNAQFQGFIDDDGYAEEQWWEDLAERIREPRGSRWSEPNRPRTDVSWIEAVAYCRWLSARTGWPVRLPVELEWEKAARGTDGRVYPWGDEYRSGFANVDEKRFKDGSHYLDETAPVGLYPVPEAVSPYGVEELSGQVWEWCLNTNALPHIRVETVLLAGRDRRVLRGGSWVSGPEIARAGYRDGGSGPVDRNSGVGFRVLSSSPIVNH
ncbi:MAG: SUMF1/EgtB/PvdO family nonheme iron enzyme [Pseudomonadota bacterium]